MKSWKFQESFIRPVSVKINPKDDFLHFMIVYNKIFNNCIDICFENQIPDYKTLNTKFYKKLRKQYPDIPSSVIQCIEKSAIGDLKGSITKYLKTNKLLRNDKNILIALSNIKKP